MDINELREEIRQIIAEVSEVDIIPDATSFGELGIDSMMAIEIVAEVERKYKLSIPEDELQELTDLDRVVEKVTSRIAA